MKTRILFLLTLMVLASITQGYGKAKVQKQQPTPPNQSYYQIGVKGTVVIRLQERAGTGYCWVWANRPQVKSVDSIGFTTQRINPNPKIVGAPTYSIWTFKGIKRGVDTLLFEQKRVFQKNSTINTTKIVIRVK